LRAADSSLDADIARPADQDPVGPGADAEIEVAQDHHVAGGAFTTMPLLKPHAGEIGDPSIVIDLR
jgi:hypothetical protein